MIRVSLLAIVLFSACVETDRPLRGEDADTTVAPDTPIAPDTDDLLEVEPCGEQGTTRCDGAEATQICNNGEWQSAVCPTDWVCVDFGGAECLSATGDSTCRDVLYCFATCQLSFADDQEGRDGCQVACFIAGSQTAQTELSLVTSCIGDGGCEDGGPATLECIDERCSLQLALCYFESTGRTSCADIVQCVTGCDDDEPTCWQECGDDGSADAQAEFAILDLCVQYACFGVSSPTCGREAMGPGGPCFEYVTQCLSPL